MKKQDRSKDLVADHLKSVEGMEEATTDPFFYTRLQARMQREAVPPVTFFRSGWAVALLALLLVINSVLLLQQRGAEIKTDTGLESFASAYDLTIQSPL